MDRDLVFPGIEGAKVSGSDEASCTQFCKNFATRIDPADAHLQRGHALGSPFFRNSAMPPSISIGSGNTMVDERSPAMVLRVCM